MVMVTRSVTPTGWFRPPCWESGVGSTLADERAGVEAEAVGSVDGSCEHSCGHHECSGTRDVHLISSCLPTAWSADFAQPEARYGAALKGR